MFTFLHVSVCVLQGNLVNRIFFDLLDEKKIKKMRGGDLIVLYFRLNP